MSARKRRGAEGKPAKREKPQQIADELRSLIIAGELSEGDSLGHEPDLVERFGVSRPSLREALRILEAEGFITVVRGVRGGVVVHEPNQRMTARTAAMVLQARNVALSDVFEARARLEPLSARAIASMRGRRSIVADLSDLVTLEEAVVEDPTAFGAANAVFHERLVDLAGNETLSMVAEMINEIVARAVTEVGQTEDVTASVSVRRRAIKAQRRLVELLESGDGPAAEAFWRSYMVVVGKVMLGQDASTIVDLHHHDD